MLEHPLPGNCKATHCAHNRSRQRKAQRTEAYLNSMLSTVGERNGVDAASSRAAVESV